MPVFLIALVLLGSCLTAWPASGEEGAQAAARTARTVWAGWRGGSGMSGCIDGSTLPEVVRFAWRWPVTAAQTTTNGSSPCTPVACLQDTLYVAIHSGTQTGLAAMATHDTTPEIRWTTRAPQTNRWFFATPLTPARAVAVDGHHVFFTDGQPGEAGRQLRCLRDGVQQWQLPVATAASGSILLTEPGGVLAVCRESELSLIRATGPEGGRVRWSTPLDAPVTTPPCVSQGMVLVGTSNGVVALVAATGRMLWRQPGPGPVLTGPVANEDIAVCASDKGVFALSLANGGTLWSIACAPSAQPLVADRRRILWTTTTGEILMSTWDGETPLRWRGALPSLPPMLFGDTLLFATADAIQRVDLARDPGTETRWMATAWLGSVTAPLLVADEVIYFATSAKGLICARQGER